MNDTKKTISLADEQACDKISTEWKEENRLTIASNGWHANMLRAWRDGFKVACAYKDEQPTAWIDYRTQKPHDGQLVLCWNGEHSMPAIFRCGNGTVCDEFVVPKYLDTENSGTRKHWPHITKWMPLPVG